MLRKLKNNEFFYIKSMGKTIRVLVISDSIKETNQYLERNKNLSVIAEFKPFIFIADRYEK